MIGTTAAAIIGGVGALGAGTIGAIQNASAQDRAALLQDKGVQEWLKVNIPNPEEQKLAVEKFVQQGELHPVMEQGLKAADTEFNKIQSDPQLKASRMRALGSLEEQGYGGEQVQDKAAREQALIESGAANRGRQQAVISDFAHRGQLGSGLELSGRLDAAQAEGDRLASNSLGLESDRRNRALAALSGAGNLAGDIQSDQYKMDSDKARASDAINLFNTNNMQNVGQRNVDRTKAAAAANLATKQRIADQNTTLSNFEQQYNKELAQQKFQNDATKAAGVSGQYGNQAQGILAAGQSAGNMWGGIASALGSTAASAAKSGDSKKRTTYDWSSNDDNDELYGRTV
jgi:hypothetical protein